VSVNKYLAGAYALAARREVVGDDEPEDARAARQIAREVDVAVKQLTSAPNADGGRTVDGGGTPGSFSPPPRPARRLLPSPLEGVDDEAWTRWVSVMRVADAGTVSDTSKLGLFGFKMQRLADLGLVENVSPTNARKTGHMAWTGDWKEPLTQEAFLTNQKIQYMTLVNSTRLYAMALASGDIALPDDGELTLSGALALLHKCGPRGLEQWADESTRRPTTVKLLEATNGLF
jgi:hypothetical protein